MQLKYSGLTVVSPTNQALSAPISKIKGQDRMREPTSRITKEKLAASDNHIQNNYITALIIILHIIIYHLHCMYVNETKKNHFYTINRKFNYKKISGWHKNLNNKQHVYI